MSKFYVADFITSVRSDSSSTEKVCGDSSISKQAPIEEDSDLEVEESMPPLDSVIRKELLRKMKPKEKKLQEVINGKFATFLIITGTVMLPMHHSFL